MRAGSGETDASTPVIHSVVSLQSNNPLYNRTYTVRTDVRRCLFAATGLQLRGKCGDPTGTVYARGRTPARRFVRAVLGDFFAGSPAVQDVFSTGIIRARCAGPMVR